MLLAIDVGNTEVTIGVFEGERLADHWRVTAATGRTADEWAVLLTTLFGHAGRPHRGVRAAVVASVAPAVSAPLMDAVRDACGVSPTEIRPDTDLPLTLDVEEPLTVGADRVVNTLAAAALFGRDTIVVDFGTATTFDCITADCRFLGGVIAPGVRTAAEQLIRRTAKLPAAELRAPDHIIGRRTEDCIQAGVVVGAVEAVDGLVRRIKAEWPGSTPPYVVATGGLASLIAPLSREIESVEPELTLRGLCLAARHVGLSW